MIVGDSHLTAFLESDSPLDILDYGRRSLQEDRKYRAPHSRKLPFVWQLTLDGVSSHAIGTIHGGPDYFREHLGTLLDDKRYAILENKDRARITEYVRAEYLAAARHFVFEAGLEKDYLAGDKNVRFALLEHAYRTFLGKLYGETHIRGVDDVVLELARKRRIAIRGIHSHAELDALSSTEDAVWARCEEKLSAGDALSNAYYADPAGLEVMLDADSRIVREHSSAQEWCDICKRNQEMVGKSVRYLCEPTLIAFGAAHFFGPSNVLTSYQEQGVAVERIF